MEKNLTPRVTDFWFKGGKINMIKKIFSIYICMLLIVLGFTAIAAANEPPTIPTIDGPTSGKAGVSQSYKFRSTDPEGDDIVYCIEWGCGESECTDPYPSGEESTASHTYAEGKFIIRAKAIDSNQDESDWATLSITMPRNRVTQTPFLNFLEQHPNIFPILRLFLQRL
jgi:hypothetical protein